jgi:20S proteasome alpha/beta subunit
MTLIIGIRCEEGVVIAADSLAILGTLGFTTTQNITKIELPRDDVIFGLSGFVGLGQKISDSLEQKWDYITGEKRKKIECRKTIEKQYWSVLENEIKKAAVSKDLFGQEAIMNATCTSLIAFPAEDQPVLLSVNREGKTEEITQTLPFETIGSGANWASPFLAFVKKSIWQDKLPKTVAMGALGAIWTLDHVINVIPVGGVGGDISVATLTKRSDKWRAEYMPKQLLQQHRENYKGGMEKLANHIAPINEMS